MNDEEEPVTPDFEDDPPKPITTSLSAVPPKSTSRVIVRSEIIHERSGKPARTWGQPHAFAVASNEPACDRELTVGEGWQVLELGWVRWPSLLYIKNLETEFRVNPTPEERAEADAKIIELGFGNPCGDVLISPGRSCEFEPGGFLTSGRRDLCILARCRKGQTQLLIVAVPK